MSGHRCTCGLEFSLKVELAFHREHSGHPADVAVTVTEPVLEAAPPQPAPRATRRWARPLVAAGLIAVLLGFNCLMEKTVSCYVAAQSTVMAATPQ